MKILIIGKGGREHAMCWKLAQSTRISKIFVAPGNAGTHTENKTTNIDIAVDDLKAIVEFCKKEVIDYVVVGPELPLTMGIKDLLEENKIKCFGVNKFAAQFESSKEFTKDFLQKHIIPSAEYKSFTNYEEAKSYLEKSKIPIVIKADGLAEGKGVIVATSQKEAFEALKSIMLTKTFGDAGNKVVIEEFLDGTETSSIVMSDGKNFLPFCTVQDNKTLLDNNIGPNTGGMGVSSPSLQVSAKMEETIQEEIISPILQGMKDDNILYEGFLFVGIMICNNKPYVLEINCRLGDPETQAIMLRMKSDFAILLEKAMDRNLANFKAEWHEKTAISVVMAAENYPSSPIKGAEIPNLNSVEEVVVFHAGTKIKNNSSIVNGGRVLNVSCIDDNPAQARKKIYQAIEKLKWKNCQFRTDI